MLAWRTRRATGGTRSRSGTTRTDTRELSSSDPLELAIGAYFGWRLLGADTAPVYQERVLSWPSNHSAYLGTGIAVTRLGSSQSAGGVQSWQLIPGRLSAYFTSGR